MKLLLILCLLMTIVLRQDSVQAEGGTGSSLRSNQSTGKMADGLPDRCSLPKKRGKLLYTSYTVDTLFALTGGHTIEGSPFVVSCAAAIPRWYFDSKSKTCKQFTYT